MNKKLYKTGTIFLILFLGLFFTACKQGPSVPAVDDSQATTEGLGAVVNANNQFALELYSKLNEKDDGNIFFSPYSISTALAMTYEGAKGQTADEMQKVFHFPEDANVRRPAFAKIYNLLNSGSKDYKLNTANALWAQKDYAFLPEYLGLVEKYYGGRTTNLDFIGETEKSRQIINTWVEEQTNDKIKDIIPPGTLSSLTRLVLTNAIYFKGTWVKEFEKSKTKEQNFKVSADKNVQVPMMRRTDKDAKFNYYENEELQVLEMLYKGEELSMLVLLPKDDNLQKLEDSLTLEKIAEWKNGLSERKIDVYMPKFTFETKYFMANTLAEMGMPIAFSPEQADFSGMTGNRNLFISAVIHQAFVEVNEEGTEAAAATIVVMGKTSAGPMDYFRADHPFIFIIQERETGSILFIGRVVDPTAK
jgi:serpin B